MGDVGFGIWYLGNGGSLAESRQPIADSLLRQHHDPFFFDAVPIEVTIELGIEVRLGVVGRHQGVGQVETKVRNAATRFARDVGDSGIELALGHGRDVGVGMWDVERSTDAPGQQLTANRQQPRFDPRCFRSEGLAALGKGAENRAREGSEIGDPTIGGWFDKGSARDDGRAERG